MNILLISVKSHTSRGGVATWTDRFLSGCNSHGISCDLVNTELIGRRASIEFASRNFFDEYIRTKRIFRDLKNSFSNDKYDAAHLNTSCGTFGIFRDYLVAKRIKKQGIRLITHFHCDIPYWVRNPISKIFLKKLLDISDVNLVLCESSRLFIKEEFGRVSYKIPNFLDNNMIIIDDKPISDTITTALFIGRVSEAKGARIIWELAGRLPNICFRIGGRVSDEVNSWDKPENIELLGALSYTDVFKEMDNADIFVFPSNSEGFSLALTEAMARGLPAIATNVGANADMLSCGCGVIVDKGDVLAMKNAISNLSDPEIRKKISYNAVKKVRQQYTTDNIFRKLKKYYES